MEELDVELTKLYGWGNQFRCQIIDSAVISETLISEILTELISTPKTRSPIKKHLFSNRLTFEIKIDLFNSLNKSKAFEPHMTDKSINKDLVYLRKIRNLMAHSRIDTADEAKTLFKQEKIRFFSITSDGLKPVIINFKGNTDDHEKLIFSQEVFIPKMMAINTRLASLLECIQNWNNSTERNAIKHLK
jgi:hypothetical protein